MKPLIPVREHEFTTGILNAAKQYGIKFAQRSQKRCFTIIYYYADNEVPFAFMRIYLGKCYGLPSITYEMRLRESDLSNV